MRKREKILIICGLGGSYLLFEYLVHKLRTIQIKKQKRVVSKSPSLGSLEALKNDIRRAEGVEKQDMLVTLKECFNIDDDSLETLIKVVHNNHPYKTEQNINDYLHFPLPFSFQVMMSLTNWLTFKVLTHICDIEYYEGKCIIYKLVPKETNNNSKVIVCFPGLSGSIVQLLNGINVMFKKGYTVILPLYGPGDVSLNHTLCHNQYDYCYEIIEYLKKRKLFEIHIFAWSLGGIKYLCFEDLILNKSNKEINIKAVYLFEPLLTSRSVIDMHFTTKRSIFRTINVVNSRTIHLSYKYRLLNCIMGYFIHTIIGLGCANSTDYLFYTEHKKKIAKYPYKRYLFVSHSDFLMNDTADKEVIENNFDPKCVFYREGYHGGWLKSSKLEPIFGNILNQY
tara:strand:+ start:139 stop:1323 length:1185 start_codon:yes stop_codon:yes gene_type:complete